MDEGWSVVIFPEGEQRIGAPMLPFQSGTGMLAVESRTPVVPVRLVSKPRRRRFSTRVAVRFGAPLTFPPNTSYIDATKQVEAAVKALIPIDIAIGALLSLVTSTVVASLALRRKRSRAT